MAKEPQEPLDADGRADKRQDSWEQQAFGANGGDIAGAATEGLGASPAEAEQRIAGHAAEAARKHAEELGEALHAKFMQLLTDKVRDKDGHLTPADVEEMGEEFRHEIQTIETAFLEAVQTYVLAQAEGRTSQSRSNFFHRLMVGNFEHRFADEKALKSQPELLSRRMLPGFFSMLSLMFGAPKLDDYEQQMTKLIDRLRQKNGGHVDWKEVYNSPEARQIALRAEIEIAQYFDNVEKRFAWMIAVVNSNLIPTDEVQSGSPWVFNAAAAENLLAGLFRDVRPALEHEDSRQTFIERMGPETVGTLEKVVQRFS